MIFDLFCGCFLLVFLLIFLLVFEGMKGQSSKKVFLSLSLLLFCCD